MNDADKFELTPTCRFAWCDYGEGSWCLPLALEYVERSPDVWYSDQETEIDIDKDTAQRLVDWITEKYQLGKEGS